MKHESMGKMKCQIQRLLVLAGLPLLMATIAAGQLQPPNVQASEHVDGVAITISRFGPYPASITRPQGTFMLFIVNRSGTLQDTFSLVLAPAASNQQASLSLLDLHSTPGKQRDHQLINPPPGSYQLLFQSHPDWVVDITITAN